MTGKNVTIIVDTDTKLSKGLKQAELDGKLRIERTDLKTRPKKQVVGNMKIRTKEQEQLMDWDNELRFESVEYSDTKVCDIAKKNL